MIIRRRSISGIERLIEIGGGRCALCGRAMSQELVKGAHIKKRSKCTEDERHDFDNVGMLACGLGCDQLFEAGLIAVGPDGELMTSDKTREQPEIEPAVRTLIKDRSTPWWTEEREKYFRWHRTHIFLQML